MKITMPGAGYGVTFGVRRLSVNAYELQIGGQNVRLSICPDEGDGINRVELSNGISSVSIDDDPDSYAGDYSDEEAA